MVRSADSIVSNIAEGYGRTGIGEQLNFYLVADGSSQELLAQIDLAHKRGLISTQNARYLSNVIRRISIQILAFSAYLLRTHPEYEGRCRVIVERRTAWMKRTR
jgi:four helix bundle protein